MSDFLHATHPSLDIGNSGEAAPRVHLPEKPMTKPDLKTRTQLAMSELLDRVLSSVAPRHHASSARALDLSELEERVLLSASPMVIAAEMVESPPASMMAEEASVLTSEAAPSSESESTKPQQPDSGLSVSPSQSVSRELVFLDTSVQDYQQLLDDLLANDDPSREIEVVLLSSSRDGIDQISESLTGRTELDAVHIVSHGTDAAVKLGSTWLTPDNLAGYVGDIARWGSSLAADADLLFFGCDLATSSGGQELIDSLALLTGADVAASDDDTGHAIFGADWELEYQVGHIDAEIAFSQSLQEGWGHIMNVTVDATSTGTTTEDSEDSVTISHTTAGTNRLMLVGVGIDPHGESVSSVTYNGTSLTLIGRVEDSGSHSRVEIWSLVAPETGTHDVVVNLTGNGHNGVTVGVMTFSGVDQATPLENFTSAFGNSDTASATVNSTPDDIVFGVVHVHGGSSVTPSASQTEYWDLEVARSNSGGTLQAGAASVVSSWTVKDDDWSVAAVSIRSHIEGTQTTSFQQGTNSYSETEDTELDSGSPDISKGANTSISVDLDDGSGQTNGLIRFDNLFGDGTGQIPTGATIHSASLRVYANDTANIGDTITLHRMLTSWGESSTWNSMSGGISANDVEAASTADATLANTDTTGFVTFAGLENSIQDWADGESNFGWAILTDSTDGWDFDSSESATTSQRPQLIITYSSPPVITLPGGALSYTENAPATVIDTTATVTDSNSADFDTGTLTVDFTANGTANDRLAIRNEGTGAGQIGVSGSNVTYEGTTIGTFAGGTDGSTPLVITFNASCTPTAAQTLMRNITFENVSDDPSETARTVRFVLTDGDGGTSSAATQTVNVSRVNDHPTGSGSLTTTSLNDNAGATNLFGGLTVDDVDSGETDLSLTITLADPTAGTITGGGFTETNVGTGLYTAAGLTVAQANTALDNVQFTPTDNSSPSGDFTTDINVTVNDQGGGGEQTVLSPATVTITRVNDAPTMTSNAGGATAATSIAENSTAVTTVMSSDPDGGTPTYSITGGADQTVFSIDSSTGDLQFVSGPDFEAPTDANEDNIYEVTVEVSDGSLTDTQSISVTVTDVDEFDVTAPNDADAAADAVNENATNGTTVGITATATDADVTNSGVTYSLFDNAGGRFTIDGSTGVVTVADGTLLDREAAASHDITIRATSEDGSTNDNTFTITVNDLNDTDPVVIPGQNFSVSEFSAAGETVGTVAATDADSIGSLQDWAITSGNEDGVFEIDAATGEVLVADNTLLNFETTAGYVLGLTVQDGTNTSATQTILINVEDENDLPVVVTNFGASVVEGSSVTVSTTNLSVTDEDALPNQILFTVVSPPVAGQLELTSAPGVAISSFTQEDIDAGRLTYIHDGSELDDSVTVSVSDGSGGTIDSIEFSISNRRVNDAPVNTVPASQTVQEDTPLTFSSAGGNGIVVSDADLNGGLIGVRLVATNGLLTLSSTTGLTFADGDGTHDPSMIFAGTVDDVNVALDGLRLDPTADYHGPASVRIISLDMGNTGSGGEKIDDDTIDISVLAVNDSPVALNDDYELAEDNTLIISAVDGLLANDSDIDLDTLSVIQVTDVSNGTLSLNSNGSFVYVPDTNFNGVDSFSYQSTDGFLQSNIRTVIVNVAAVNDAAVTVNDEYTIDQLEVLKLDAANGVLINDLDVEADPLQSILVDGPQNGSLILNPDGSLTYTPKGAFFGEDSFTYQANDGSTNGSIATVRIIVRQTISTNATEAQSQTETNTDSSDSAVTETESSSSEESVNASDGAAAGTGSLDESVDLTVIKRLMASPANLPSSETQDSRESTAETGEGSEDSSSDTSATVETTIESTTRGDLRDQITGQAITDSGLAVFTSTDVGSMVYVLEQTGFWSALDTFEQDVQSSMLEEGEWEDLVVETTTVAGTTLTVGYIFWLLRSGSVVFGLVSSLPAWTMMDPLPVLESGLENLTGGDNDDDSLQAILQSHRDGLDMGQESFEN